MCSHTFSYYPFVDSLSACIASIDETAWQTIMNTSSSVLLNKLLNSSVFFIWIDQQTTSNQSNGFITLHGHLSLLLNGKNSTTKPRVLLFTIEAATWTLKFYPSSRNMKISNLNHAIKKRFKTVLINLLAIPIIRWPLNTHYFSLL